MNNNINMAGITGQPKLEEKGKIGNIFVLVVVLVAIIIFAEGSGLVYFANKSQRLNGQVKELKGLEELKPNYEKLSREEAELKQEHAALLKRYKSMEEDRNNLAVRVKTLRATEPRTKELQESVEKMQVEKDTDSEKIDGLRDQNFAHQEEIERFKKEQVLLIEERNGLKTLYKKAKSESGIKRLKEQLAASRNENKVTGAGIKKARGNLGKLQKSLEKTQVSVVKLTNTNTELKKRLAEELIQHKKEYAEAVKKNKALGYEMGHLPKKFSELARQNKKLRTETAKMHYNLGVFYTQYKEYSRAVTEFKKAVEINPNDAYTHFNLGYIYAEHMLNRRKAIEHFRHFLRYAKADDKDTDWVRKYLLTWETYEGVRPLK